MCLRLHHIVARAKESTIWLWCVFCYILGLRCHAWNQLVLTSVRDVGCWDVCSHPLHCGLRTHAYLWLQPQVRLAACCMWHWRSIVWSLADVRSSLHRIACLWICPLSHRSMALRTRRGQRHLVLWWHHHAAIGPDSSRKLLNANKWVLRSTSRLASWTEGPRYVTTLSLWLQGTFVLTSRDGSLFLSGRVELFLLVSLLSYLDFDFRLRFFIYFI